MLYIWRKNKGKAGPLIDFSPVIKLKEVIINLMLRKILIAFKLGNKVETTMRFGQQNIGAPKRRNNYGDYKLYLFLILQ